MNRIQSSLAIGILFPLVMVSGCSQDSTKAPNVAERIRQSLDQFGYKDVSITQDRIRGVVALTGRVSADADKEQAESIARSMAAGEIVSDEIVVEAEYTEANLKGIPSDLDKGIEKNVDEALIQNKMKKNVRYRVKSGVVTLKGSVNSRIKRAQVEVIAYAVPNVKQVVNDLQVKDGENGPSN